MKSIKLKEFVANSLSNTGLNKSVFISSGKESKLNAYPEY